MFDTNRMEQLDTYRRTYKLRLAQGSRKKSFEVTFPSDVIEKESRKRGLTPEEFITKYQAIASYNSFDGVFYNFEEIPPSNNQGNSKANNKKRQGRIK